MISNSEYNDLNIILKLLNYNIDLSLIKLLTEKEFEEVLEFAINKRLSENPKEPECLIRLINKSKNLSSYM